MYLTWRFRALLLAVSAHLSPTVVSGSLVERILSYTLEPGGGSATHAEGVLVFDEAFEH
eukprot:SAG31_NODE_10897_length_1086_cov_1.096251_1_plen_58_part_01